jgi:uncharacterized protein YdeI (YjbR/CyaY-like superfamily)
MNTNPKVDWFLNNATQWQKEFEQLRIIILDCGLGGIETGTGMLHLAGKKYCINTLND